MWPGEFPLQKRVVSAVYNDWEYGDCKCDTSGFMDRTFRPRNRTCQIENDCCFNVEEYFYIDCAFQGIKETPMRTADTKTQRRNTGQRTNLPVVHTNDIQSPTYNGPWTCSYCPSFQMKSMKRLAGPACAMISGRNITRWPRLAPRAVVTPMQNKNAEDLANLRVCQGHAAMTDYCMNNEGFLLVRICCLLWMVRDLRLFLQQNHIPRSGEQVTRMYLWLLWLRTVRFSAVPVRT